MQPELPFLLADEEPALHQPLYRHLRLCQAERLTELGGEALEGGDRSYELANGGRLSLEDLARKVREERTARVAWTAEGALSLVGRDRGQRLERKANGRRPAARLGVDGVGDLAALVQQGAAQRLDLLRREGEIGRVELEYLPLRAKPVDT